MSESFSIPTPGDTVAGKYLVKEELGRGAYGVVFRAEQIGLARSVALKTLLPQAFLQVDIVQRFHREAQLISRLDHGNIIKLYDYGVDEGLLYMAVEYVEGRTLSSLIKEDAPLPLEQVRDISTQILEALGYAHREGIVHRDLKPENIVMLKSRPLEGEMEEVVKVLDFGIAKLIQDESEGALKTLTQDGTVLGTPHYMSPENIVGDSIDHTADLYAAGVIMFEMLTGEHPFEAPSPSAVMVRHLRDDAPHLPPPLKGTSFDLAIQAALEKQPLDRIQSAKELLDLMNSQGIEGLPQLEAGAVAEAAALAAALPDPAIRKEKVRAQAFLIAAVLFGILMTSVSWKLWTVFTRTEPVELNDPIVLTPDAGTPDLGTRVVVESPVEDLGMGAEEFVFDEEPDLGPQKPEVVANHQPDKPEKPEKPEPKKPEKAEQVRLTVNSTPSNASVTLNGKPIGSTPLSVNVDQAKDSVTIRVSLLGYKNQVHRVVPSEDRKLAIKLEYDRIKMFD